LSRPRIKRRFIGHRGEKVFQAGQATKPLSSRESEEKEELVGCSDDGFMRNKAVDDAHVIIISAKGTAKVPPRYQTPCIHSQYGLKSDEIRAHDRQKAEWVDGAGNLFVDAA
jgi:hypothetical protein